MILPLLQWLGIVKKVTDEIKDIIPSSQKMIEPTEKPVLAQIDNNKIMAMSKNFFTYAWPALIGWTCGLLVLIYYAPQIIIMTYVWGNYCIDNQVMIPFPIAPDDIIHLIYLLFGFGGYTLIKRGMGK
jgi:hypothetical protein